MEAEWEWGSQWEVWLSVAGEPTTAINGLLRGRTFFALLFFCIPLASNLTLATSLMLFCSVHGVAASFE